MDPEVTTISIVSGCLDWIKENRRMIMNEVFVMSMNFVNQIKMNHFFRLLIHNSDLVMIKWLYKEFLYFSFRLVTDN